MSKNTNPPYCRHRGFKKGMKVYDALPPAARKSLSEDALRNWCVQCVVLEYDPEAIPFLVSLWNTDVIESEAL